MFGTSEKQKLEDWIEKQYENSMFHLVNGKAKDFADYRDRVGFMRALKEVGTEITRLEKERDQPIIKEENK